MGGWTRRGENGASKVRGWKDQPSCIETGAVNIFAQEMSADAEEAMGVASSGDVQFCVYNTVIICVHDREDRPDEAAGFCLSKLSRTLGFCLFAQRLPRERGREPGAKSPGDTRLLERLRRVILYTLEPR